MNERVEGDDRRAVRSSEVTAETLEETKAANPRRLPAPIAPDPAEPAVKAFAYEDRKIDVPIRRNELAEP